MSDFKAQSLHFYRQLFRFLHHFDEATPLEHFANPNIRTDSEKNLDSNLIKI